jgi:hypothetical protein
LIPNITAAADWERPAENAWINVVFSGEGLRRLGLDQSVLAGFPPEFLQGMAARKASLGDLGHSDPLQWDLPHGGTGFRIGMFVMGGSEAPRDEKRAVDHAALAGLSGVTLVSRLDVGVPPTLRERFT